MSKTVVKQRTRLGALVIYINILFIANYVAFHQVLPPNGAKGLWFYSGFASILLGNLLVTPFFTKPVDAISYSVAAVIALYSVLNWAEWQLFDKIFFVAALCFFFFILFISFISIILKDSASNKLQRWSNISRILSDYLGNQGVIFSTVILFALSVFHKDSSIETFIITLAWVSMVIIKPDELLFKIYHKITTILKSSDSTYAIGDIAAYQTPGIALVRQKGNENIPFGTPLVFKDSHAPIKMGIALDYVGRDESLLVRAAIFAPPAKVSDKVSDICKLIPDDTVTKCTHILDNLNITKESPILGQINEFVGIVATDSSIEHLYFEVIIERGLEEGKLVEVIIKDKHVLYQVIDGLTKEEVVYQKNTFGYARAKAQKIGVWDSNKKRFIPAKWIPCINTPVFLKSESDYIPEINTIGHFPGSNYIVNIKNVNHLVTHNTAILGILGVGKSMLSIELIERMIAEGIKVICIDLTNQYQIELAELYDDETAKKEKEYLQKIGAIGKSVYKKNVEEGGSINQFAIAMKKVLQRYLNPENPCMLKIFNPSEFEVWRQDSRIYNDSASMVSLTPTEITQIVTESALEIAQDFGMTDKARICLVYEEAHSLVPEWNSVVSEGDKAATNGTARAILQGRKYGLGCLLITQRTANVTKTILNQCNTIFAMRTFDDTGKDFLSNYIGSDYASILSSLEERHAVFFGKASSCENPVLIRLNDRNEFLEVFRNVFPPKITQKDTVKTEIAAALQIETSERREQENCDIS